MKNWNMYLKMEEAEGAAEPSGGGGAETPVETPTAQESAKAEAEATVTESAEEAKPYLGEGKTADKADKADAPKPATEEDYLKAAVKDEKLLGSDAHVQLDEKLLKAMVPLAQELGVTPENMGKMANALAKAQIDQAKEYMKGRLDYFEKMKAESMRTYTPGDFEQINVGIDRWFKPGGVMNNVIRNSELGADPEFLALMHHLGGASREDAAAGAANGGGSSSGDPNGIDGMAKLW